MKIFIILISIIVSQNIFCSDTIFISLKDNQCLVPLSYAQISSEIQNIGTSSNENGDAVLIVNNKKEENDYKIKIRPFGHQEFYIIIKKINNTNSYFIDICVNSTKLID